ncbi:hypothetical protein ACHAWC_008396 [Mediolabrus comicus]
MKTRSLVTVTLHLLLHQTNGFVPASQKSSSSSLLLSESKNNILENIFEKTRSKNEQQTEKLLMDPMADMKSSAEVYTSDSTVVSSWSYAEFAKNYPNVNNIGIATIKTASADLLAQVAIAHTPITDIDWERAFLFCAFGAIYLGAFQYWYQVNIFKKLFDVDKFTSQSWADKLKDTEGLKSLAAQTAVDLTVLTFIYLPTFYIFKAGVFSGSADPSIWLSTGLDNYNTNFAKDEFDLVRVWAPADLVCFSVPLYLRLPVRHLVSFVWTAYLSFARGGH